MRFVLPLLIGALTAIALPGADTRYTFDFSGSSVTGGERVIVTYTVFSTTAPGVEIPGAARRGSGNHALRAARNTSGAWTFHDTSDPRSAFSITAHAGLTFANTPGTYTSIPATAVAACSPLCAGRSGTTAAGSVNITIELTGATPAAQAAPAIYGGGVVNAANFMVNTLPGGGIAQGSIFTIFGSGLGPANYVQVSSFPLGPQFNGVSINLKQGSQQISGIPLFVYATQINALLPSNTPLGTVSLQVVYNGQASNWAPVQVVAHAPAVFTATGTGMGWAIFQNYVSASSQPLNSGLTAATPGQVGTLWLTGSGPISGADGDTPPVGNLPFPVEIFVGGVSVPAGSILYSGRAPGISGLDQYVFYVPSNAPTGCFVPVYVRVAGAVSGATTMAIMPQGGACSDTHNPISAALIAGGKIVNGVFYQAVTPIGQFANYPPVVISVDQASASATQQAGGQFAFDPFLAQPPRGACSSYTMGGNIMATGFNLASAGRPLDLGTVTANSAGNNVPLTSPKAGLYSTLLGGGYPPIAPFFASGVIPSLHASGGADGKSFDVPVPAGVILTGSNLQALNLINRSTSASISWNAQAGVSAYLMGGVYDQPSSSSMVFVCISAAGASTLTVPDYVLANLPVTLGVSDQGDSRLFFSALPAINRTTTTDQLQIFSARQDLSVLAITAVH